MGMIMGKPFSLPLLSVPSVPAVQHAASPTGGQVPSNLPQHVAFPPAMCMCMCSVCIACAIFRQVLCCVHVYV